MTVKQLIQKLEQFDPNHMVIIHGYEGGVDEATRVSEVPIKLNVNEQWYYGSHETVEKEEEHDCLAILIG